MSRRRSFSTLLSLVVCARAVPLADDDDSGDDDDDDCGSDTPQLLQLAVPSTPAVHVPVEPPATILAPFHHPPVPRPSPSQHPHATLPVSHPSQTPAILGTLTAILIALVAFVFTARYVARRRRIDADPFKDPSRPRFAAFRLRRSLSIKKRLSDESWVSPTLPTLGSLTSPLSQDLELRRYALPQRKLVPVTTPICTPTDTEFGSRLDGNTGSAIHVPPVRVPSPVYFSPFSPSPSISSSSSSLSLTHSTEPLASPSPSPARLSRLLSSTFRDSRTSTSLPRPSTAHLIQTARSYAHAYRPSSATTTSLYTPPTPSARFSGTRSRTSFYPGPTDAHAAWGRVRDTFSTVTTSDTVCTIPHLLRAVSEVQPSTSPFADPVSGTGDGDERLASARDHSTNIEGRTQMQIPMGTSLGLKLRLSDASEHAHYRLREKEREYERQRSRQKIKERVEQRLSTDTRMSEATATSAETVHIIRKRSRSLDVEEMKKEFKLRDSESVLREIGW